MITTQDKLRCIERELRHLRAYYRTQVELGLVNEMDAAGAIAILESIAEDYRSLLAQ